MLKSKLYGVLLPLSNNINFSSKRFFSINNNLNKMNLENLKLQNTNFHYQSFLKFAKMNFFKKSNVLLMRNYYSILK